MTKEVNEKQDEPRAYECTFYADPEEPFLSFEPIRSGTNIPLYAKPQPNQENTDWEAVAADQALTIALLKTELDTRPQPRKPLTDEQKKNIFLKFYGKHWAYTTQIKNVMEAVEAAHGIKE